MSNSSNENKAIGTSYGKVFINGLIVENPTFVLMLGMCPTLAVTTSAINGFGMGMTTTVVLTMSNIIISLLRKVIPDKVRIPAFIVIIASFVTIVGQFLEAYIPTLNSALGMFIPLIVVNCIILGRAEAFASKNNCLLSAVDGIGMGLGFTGALTIIGLIREMIGAHKAFGITFAEIAKGIGMPESVVSWISNQYPIAIFVMAPGAFFVLAFIVAIINNSKNVKAKKNALSKVDCNMVDHDCANCAHKCEHAFYDTNGIDGSVYDKNKIEGNGIKDNKENKENKDNKDKEEK